MAKSRTKVRRARKRSTPTFDVENSFLEGLVRRDPDYVEAWEILGDNYLAAGRVKDALRADERLTRLLPEDHAVRYNLACSLALNGELDRAVAELHRALDLGFRDFRFLAGDPELASVRDHPHYLKLNERIRSLESEKP